MSSASLVHKGLTGLSGLLGLVLCIGAVQAAEPTTRGLALVVGNLAYSDPLKTTIKDAESFAKTLESLGFSVDMRRNLSLGGFDDAVGVLATNAALAKVPVIFYYAGHGIQVNGVNYLLPVEIDLRKQMTPSEVATKTFSVDKLFDAIRRAGAVPKIVILDACRDNPFAQVTTTDWIPGLAAPTKVPPNTLVAFATNPGDTAADGRGIHSPYTSSLLRAVKNPGILALEVFRRVKENIEAVMGDGQTPWINSSLSTPFYFWEPIELRTKITDGDDEVVVSVNGQETASWNNDGAAERVSQLRGGTNLVEVRIFNQRSYTGGVQPVGHFPEGWRFAVTFSDAQGKALVQATGAEDRPQDVGPRHGRLFTAARFEVEVDVETGKVQVVNQDLDYWRHPARATVNCEASSHPFARGHCALQECPLGQWVRGTVGLTRDGSILISQGLETDRLDYGICGSLSFDLLNRNGQVVASGKTPTRCIPGKAPGPVRISEMPLERLALPHDYVASVSAIKVFAQCGSNNHAPFGLGGRADDPGPSSLELRRK